MGKEDIVQIRVGKNTVGIVGLHRAIEEIAVQFAPGTAPEAAHALLHRLKKRNYIPDAAEEDYQKAFLREFKRSTGRSVEDQEETGLTIRILGQGCARCDGLERDIIEVMAAMGLTADIEHVRGIKEIAAYGVMGVPALIINGEVKSVGSVPARAKLMEWLREAHKRVTTGVYESV